VNRRRFLLASLAGAFSAPLTAGAQQAGKVARLGLLRLGPASANAGRVEALRTGLREHGYVEGKNIVIEFRYAETADQLSQQAAELVRMNVDIIFATSSTEVRAVQQVTKTIPIVFATNADPVSLGHVASLARPGGNTTGLSIVAHRARLAELALKHRLPSITSTRENVEAGGLMSYAPDLLDLTRRAATYIDKILKGAKPADLPVERASKYELVINLKTAKALGLTIPPSLLARADQVIE
jgi:ABC-type uncharacterized transport system substrate-binding protein